MNVLGQILLIHYLPMILCCTRTGDHHIRLERGTWSGLIMSVRGQAQQEIGVRASTGALASPHPSTAAVRPSPLDLARGEDVWAGDVALRRCVCEIVSGTVDDGLPLPLHPQFVPCFFPCLEATHAAT